MKSVIGGLALLAVGVISLTSAPIPWCAHETIVQVLYLQDVSWSYTNDLPGAAAKIPQVMDLLGVDVGLRQFAVVSFSDKPRADSGYYIDYCYREEVGFTDHTPAIVDALADLNILSGRDWKESQLDALKRGIQSLQLGWIFDDIYEESYVLRVALLATDAGPHEKGVFPDLPDDAATCGDEDYPSLAAIGELFSGLGICPILMVTPDILWYWMKLVMNDWPTAKVIPITYTVEQIVQTIMDCIADICPDLTTPGPEDTTFRAPSTTEGKPDPIGCGDSQAAGEQQRSSCAEVCAQNWLGDCVDEDTDRINRDQAECREAIIEASNVAIDNWNSVPDTSSAFATGCNANLNSNLGTMRTGPEPYNCSAVAGNAGGNKRLRYCCCKPNEEPPSSSL